MRNIPRDHRPGNRGRDGQEDGGERVGRNRVRDPLLAKMDSFSGGQDWRPYILCDRANREGQPYGSSFKFLRKNLSFK